MYSHLSRDERRNYYGNPDDPVYARRLREQRDAYLSGRMGSDYPRSSSSQRPESCGTRGGGDYPQGQYGYYGVADRDPMRSDPRGYEAAEGYERYISRSWRSRSPTRVEGESGYNQYSANDYDRSTSRYDRSSRQYDPRRDSSSWSSTYAEPRDGYQRGSYDYARSSRYEVPAPAYRGSNNGDRSSAAYRLASSRHPSGISFSMTSSRTHTPMNGYQGYQYSADTVQHWYEDRYLADGYDRR